MASHQLIGEVFRKSSTAAATSIALTEFPAPECIFWTRPAATFGDLFICAKDLFVEANDERVTQHGPLRWRASRVGGKKPVDRLSTQSNVEDGKW